MGTKTKAEVPVKATKVVPKAKAKTEKVAPKNVREKVSAIEAQKAFAMKMMEKGKGKITRQEIADALAEKFNIAASSAKSYVYRWFVGKEYKNIKVVAKAPKVQAKVEKAPVKKEAPKAEKKSEKKAPVKKVSKSDTFEFA